MQTEISPISARASLGRTLRAQRLVQCMSIAEVALQLRLPVEIVEAMERDDHERLDAADFARSRIGSYARLLGIPLSHADAQLAQTQPQPLASGAFGSQPGSGPRWFAGKLVRIAVAAAIVIAMIATTTMHRVKPVSESFAVPDGSASAMHGGILALEGDARKDAAFPGAAPDDAQHVSTAPSTRAASTDPTASAEGDLQLRFSGENWVDIVGPDGRVIDRGKVEAGSVRHYRAAAVARVAIGDPASVLVLDNGEPVDLKPFRGADRTRFALSSSGHPMPVRD